MSATTSTLMTFEDFERLPERDEGGKDELLDGELIQLPEPSIVHMDIVHCLYDLLKPIVQKEGPVSGLGRVYIETGYRIGPRTWLVPDVSITHAGQPRARTLEGAPAVAIEVISGSNTAEQMDQKTKTYLANGAREVWVVYPKTRCIWVFRPDGAREFRDVLQSDLIPGLRLELERIFNANPVG